MTAQNSRLPAHFCIGLLILLPFACSPNPQRETIENLYIKQIIQSLAKKYATQPNAIRMVLEAPQNEAAFRQTMAILARRLKSQALTQAKLSRVGATSRIVLEYPVNARGNLHKLLAVGKLELWHVCDVRDSTQYPAKLLAYVQRLTQDAMDASQFTNGREPLELGFSSLLASDTALINSYMERFPPPTGNQPAWEISAFKNQPSKWALHILKADKIGTAAITGPIIEQAEAAIDDMYGEPVNATTNTGHWLVEIKLTKRGADQFGKLTRDAIGKPIAIVIDSRVYMAPVVQSEISGPLMRISGNFTALEAFELSTLLTNGSLPAPLTILEEGMIAAKR
jgi:hypothetical protein